MNNKGQCGRDFPPSKESGLDLASVAGASAANNSSSPITHPAAALAAEGVDDLGSDPDVDVEHEGEFILPI